jgi:septal ring factor EnvC (AmiA/AmiB activator)
VVVEVAGWGAEEQEEQERQERGKRREKQEMQEKGKERRARGMPTDLLRHVSVLASLAQEEVRLHHLLARLQEALGAVEVELRGREGGKTRRAFAKGDKAT